MSKLSIVLCALLFASVAFADDMEEYNKGMLEFQLGMCFRSITGAGRELQQYYSTKKISWEDYRDKIESLNELRSIARQAKSIEFSPEITTYAGGIIFCNKDVADKVRDITYGVAG